MSDWYYGRESRQHGPKTLDQLKEMLRSGDLNGNDLIFGPTLKDWTPADQVPELGGTPAPATPASAAPSVGTLHYSMPSSGLPAFTAQAMEMLRQTRPWVRFMGIMLYIIAGLSAAGGIVLFVLLITTGGRNTDGWLGFLYVPFALLYLVPGIYLNRYASRIAQLQQFNREDMLEEALAAQKSFWKFCGIVLIVIVALYIALAAVMMVIAMM